MNLKKLSQAYRQQCIAAWPASRDALSFLQHSELRYNQLPVKGLSALERPASAMQTRCVIPVVLNAHQYR